MSAARWANRRRGALAAPALAVIAMVGCSGSVELADHEAQVCDALAEVATHLENDRGPDALLALEELRLAVDATSNDALASGGGQFIAAISEPVDYGEMTVDEHIAEGERVLAEAGAGLETVGLECERLGRPVEVDLDALAPPPG